MPWWAQSTAAGAGRHSVLPAAADLSGTAVGLLRALPSWSLQSRDRDR